MGDANGLATVSETKRRGMIKELWRLKPEDASVYGGKATGLGTLGKIGSSVPPGWAIAAGDDITAYEPWQDLKKTRKHFAVRSSHPQEDSGAASFAGQFLTRLNRTWLKVPAAIEECRASVEAARPYAEAMGVELRGEMAVVVQ